MRTKLNNEGMKAVCVPEEIKVTLVAAPEALINQDTLPFKLGQTALLFRIRSVDGWALSKGQ